MRSHFLKKNLGGLGGVLLLAINMPSFADDNQLASHFYVSAGIQANDLQVKQVNTIPTPGLLPQELDTTGGANFSLGTNFSLGYIAWLTPAWSLHSGVSVYFNNEQQVNGRYYSTPYTPGYDNPYLAYHYSLQSSQYMMESSLWFHVHSRLSAFLGAGLGLSNVQTSALTFDESGSVIPPSTNSVDGDYLATSVGTGLAYHVTSHADMALSVKKSWLGTNSMLIADGTGDYVKSKVNIINPWQFELSLVYDF